MSPKIIKNVYVGRNKFLVDGEEFPFAILADSITANIHPDGSADITMTLIAEHIELDGEEFYG